MAKKEAIKQYGTPASPIYGLGVVGAAVFYFQQAEGFWNFVLGALKAIVWPAIVVYRFLESLL